MRVNISAKTVRGPFVKRVEALSGQKLLDCYQCGKCSAGCPLAEEMEIIPSQIIRLTQLGMEDEVLRANTIWFCASCFQCYSRCPKGIDFSSIAEALRMIAMGKKMDYCGPTDVPSDILAEAPQQALASLYRKFSV